jgi:hypothetical protein
MGQRPARRVGSGAALGQNAPVQVIQLESTDAFVIVDLEDADRAAGIVRCARKILTDGAVNLARHATYAFAIAGVRASGASAGINADGDGRDAAVAAFVREYRGAARLSAGKGVTSEELTELPDDRSAAARERARELEVVGIVATIDALTGGIAGRTVTVDVSDPELAAALLEAGATVPDGAAIDTPSDVLVVGSRVGAIDHENIASVQAPLLVASAPLPVTTRGLATAARLGITVAPDFVTLVGPYVAAWPEDSGMDPVEATRALVDETIEGLRDHPAGLVLGACERAETFISSWRSELPFGRPLP